MNKVYIQNLGMTVTNKCNLNCNHCLRGCSQNKSMSKEVVEAVLDQVVAIGNLALCGGEPTFALEVIENIFKYIIQKNILVDQISTTINGTNYSTEFLKLLSYINSYVPDVNFAISYDDYHKSEIVKLNMVEQYSENIAKYMESKYFYNLRQLNSNLKLFREGNAENLDKNLTVGLKPIDIVITYVNKLSRFDRNGLCNIGPLMSVNADGIITEDNASFIHQQTLYNYGNILTDSFEEVALEIGKVVKPKQWNKETAKIIKKYSTYNK